MRQALYAAALLYLLGDVAHEAFGALKRTPGRANRLATVVDPAEAAVRVKHAIGDLERLTALQLAPGRPHAGTAAASWALLGRLRAGDERIRSLQLRFDRGALARRRRRKLRAQLVPFLLAVPTSMDFGGVQTSTHDDDPPSGIVTAAGGIGRRTPRHARPRATIRRNPRDAGCLSARFTSAR